MNKLLYERKLENTNTQFRVGIIKLIRNSMPVTLNFLRVELVIIASMF